MKQDIRTFQSGKELVEFLDTSDCLLHLMEPEADMLLGYLEGHGYALEECNGEIFRKDINTDSEESERTQYTIDEIIDCVCDWNYNLLLETEAERDDSDNDALYEEKDEYLKQLKKDEQVLDKMFDRTVYGKRIEEMGEKLALAIIQKYQQGENIGDVVHAVMGEIRQSGEEKKGVAR